MSQEMWHFLHGLVTSEISDRVVSKFQIFCGIGKNNQRNVFFDTYFKISSACGDEIFNLIPLLFWLTPEISLAYLTNFAFTLTLGQVVKDLLKLPRPHGKNSSHEIHKLEAHYGTEYGMPSTHTMAGFLPLSVALRLYARGCNIPVPVWVACGICIMSVALSRLYMGVHSVMDLISGAVLAGMSVALINAGGDSLDEFLYKRPESLFTWILFVLVFVTYYPSTKPWSASTSTACQIFGLAAGLGSAAWFAQTQQPACWNIFLQYSLLGNRDNGAFGNWEYILGRVISATLAIMVAKTISKLIASAVFTSIFRTFVLSRYDPLLMKDSDNNAVSIEKLYPVEIPVR
jgi:membrane-associated phospholipid phosphatase